MKENPLHFSFKWVQAHLQPLTHPSHGAVLAWGELWAPSSSARGKPYAQALGDPMRTGALKVVDGVVPTTTSSWLFQPNLQLGMHNALQYHLANFSQRPQLILLSREAPHTAAKCYSRRRQVRWRQQGGWHCGASSSTGSVFGQRKSPALGVQTQLPLGLLPVILLLPTTWDTAAVLHRSPPPGAEELQGKIYPSVIRDKAAHLAAFSFILSIKNLYSILTQCQPCKTSP